MASGIIAKTVILFAAVLETGAADGQTPLNEPIKIVHISGRVADVTGAPRTDAEVAIKVAELSWSTATTETDVHGRFTFPVVASQDYELVIRAPRFRPLTLPVRVPNSSADIDLGTVVLEVASIEEPVKVSYEPSTLPNWLKSEPGARMVPTEDTAGSNWPTTACSKVQRSGRRIVSMNQLIEFYVPPFARMTETADADYVHYQVRYGSKREKTWLTFMIGPMIGGYSLHDLQSTAIRWTWRKWSCNNIAGVDVQGLSSDGRKWRNISIPASGFAAYEGVGTKAADYFDRILDTLCCGKCSFCK